MITPGHGELGPAPGHGRGQGPVGRHDDRLEVERVGWSGLWLDADGVLGLVVDDDVAGVRPHLEAECARPGERDRPANTVEAVVPGSGRNGDPLAGRYAVAVTDEHRRRVQADLGGPAPGQPSTEPRVPAGGRRKRLVVGMDLDPERRVVLAERHRLSNPAGPGPPATERALEDGRRLGGPDHGAAPVQHGAVDRVRR